MDADRPVNLNALREREFPIVAEYCYLNAATMGPLPNQTRAAIERTAALAQFPETGRTTSTAATIDLAGTRLARLLKVRQEDLAFTSNTTHGLNICANGIDWRPGDNVVLPEREFPSVMYAWLPLRKLGVDVRMVPWHGAGPSVDEIMAAVDSRTRVVSCSAVAWDSGYRIDLEELGRRCEMAGCLLIVDGIQAVGAIDLEPQALRISALAFHGYKWLLASFGCGVLYVSPAAVDRIRPTFVGPQSVLDESQDPNEPLAWQPGARRYMAGSGNLLGLTALAASLELIERIGAPAIAAHNRGLIELLVRGLRRHEPHLHVVSSLDPARQASIITFTLGERARDEELVRALGEQGVIVALRPLGVRVSPHLYNNEADIERFLDALGAYVQRSTAQ